MFVSCPACRWNQGIDRNAADYVCEKCGTKQIAINPYSAGIGQADTRPTNAGELRQKSHQRAISLAQFCLFVCGATTVICVIVVLGALFVPVYGGTEEHNLRNVIICNAWSIGWRSFLAIAVLRLLVDIAKNAFQVRERN